MKIKKFGILTLCFVLLVSTISIPAALAAENTTSAAFASVDFTTYKNPGDSQYPSIGAFNAAAATSFGSDWNSTAFGENMWYMYNNASDAGVAGSNGATIQSWSKDSTTGLWTIPNADLSLRLKNNNNSANVTGIYRYFATPISVTEDKTYYFNFVASLSSLSGQTANEMRLGVLNSNTWARNQSYEVDVFGGLKLNTEDSTYRAQVSLDKGTTVATGTSTYSLGTTYNFLMRLDIDADGNDTLRMKVYEAGAAEPAAWDVTTTGDLGTNFNLDRLSMDAYDLTSAVSVYKIDIEAYDTALLDSVVPQIDAKFANFKYSEADAVEEAIKTLPLGMIRTSYETKLAALKEQTNTFFLHEDFESYKPDLTTQHGWSGGPTYYKETVNTLSKQTEAVNGWRANEGWSAYSNQQKDATGNLNMRFNYNSTDSTIATSIMTRNNLGAYRNFANNISKDVDGAYYFAFDLSTGNNYYHEQMDARVMFALNGTYDTYVGLKYSYGDLSAQMNAGGASLIGAKEYNPNAGNRYIVLTKLEVTDGNLVMKMKVYPKGGTEPANWELVSAPIALTTDITGIGVVSTAVNVGLEVYEIWAEKYIGDNLTKINTVKANIANDTVTTEAEVKAAIDTGFAQNELIASLGAEKALLFGQDVAFDSSTNAVSLKVNNSRKASVDVTPVIALYQGEIMVGAKIGEKVTLTAQTPNQNVSVAYGATAPEYNTVKIFLLNNLNNLVPMLEAWGYTIPTV